MPVKGEPYVWKGIPYSDLSASLDPHSVYVSRALSLASKAKPGLERFAFMVFGPSFIGSLAFALDPWSEYRFPTMKITPMNRTRSICCIPFSSRACQDSTTTETAFSQQDPNFPCGVSSTTGAAGVKRTSSTAYGPIAGRVAQQPVFGVHKDTSVRTRPFGSKGGEFELYVPYIDAPARNSYSRDELKTIYFSNVDCVYQHSETNYDRRTNGIGPGFYADTTRFTTLLAEERSLFTQMVNKHAFGMVRESVPSNRKYSLARNVAELKDLPLLLKRSVEVAKDVSTLLELRGQGNQYLNYKFGWEATVRAVTDMLKVPETIAKQVNYLIERNGLSTNFVSTRRGTEPYGGVGPVIFFDTYAGEFDVRPDGGQHRREWQMRTVVNYTLRFPKIDVPLLRQDLLDTKWGAYPKPQDVYALVPWTWLVDWFGGLGEYVDLLNTLAGDPSLVNYGYMTYKSKVIFPVQRSWKKTNTRSTNIDGVTVNSSFDKTDCYTGEVGYRYQRRVDISTIGGVKALSKPTSLSGGQLAILGALLTKFASN